MTYALGAIVLAAGMSSRMGQFKLLMKWLNDRPILAHVVEQILVYHFDHVVVVTGNQADQVQSALARYDVRFVHNPDYEVGEIASSLRVGLEHMPEHVHGALVIPGDMPRITSSVISQTIQEFAPDRIVAPSFDGQRGHPVLFGRKFWPEIIGLKGGQAPREVLKRHHTQLHLVNVDDDGILVDIDTQEIYLRELNVARCSKQ